MLLSFRVIIVVTMGQTHCLSFVGVLSVKVGKRNVPTFLHLLFFLSLSENTLRGYSIELPQRSYSSEYHNVYTEK